jgi:hypothetical protein
LKLSPVTLSIFANQEKQISDYQGCNVDTESALKDFKPPDHCFMSLPG